MKCKNNKEVNLYKFSVSLGPKTQAQFQSLSFALLALRSVAQMQFKSHGPGFVFPIFLEVIHRVCSRVAFLFIFLTLFSLILLLCNII